MLRFLVFFITLLPLALQSRPPKPSAAEWRWALFHPLAALQVNKITKACDQLMRQAAANRLDSFSSGGQLDAFRHVFHMAGYAQKIKGRKLVRLGQAHEKGNYRDFLRHRSEDTELPDSLSSIMDLLNNEVGIRAGQNNKNSRIDELAGICVQLILAGEAWTLRRNKAGKFTDCNGKELQLQTFTHQWNIPKCLVHSDYEPTD